MSLKPCKSYFSYPTPQDLWNPNSVNKDPLFPNNKIADHEPGYPGLTLFVVSL